MEGVVVCLEVMLVKRGGSVSNTMRASMIDA